MIDVAALAAIVQARALLADLELTRGLGSSSHGPAEDEAATEERCKWRS
jgi:hypothetical protein